MRLFDITINLSDPMFKGIYREKSCHPNDLNDVVRRAVACKVNKFLLTGTNLESSKLVETLSRKINSFYTVGIHPTHANEFKKDFEGIRSLLNENKLLEIKDQRIMAIGECGLDYDRLYFAGKEEQLECFENHFNLAAEFQLPMFFHLRAADEDFLEIVKRNCFKFSTGVVHSFNGPADTMKSLLNLGLFIGINGCSLKTVDNLQVLKEIPLDRLLIETDSPWCDVCPSHASYPYLQLDLAKMMEKYEIPSFKSLKKEKFVKGEMVKGRNEPGNLYQVLFIIANLRQIDVKVLAETIYQNTLNFLCLEKVLPIAVPSISSEI
jgi:TatD DNase family protein